MSATASRQDGVWTADAVLTGDVDEGERLRYLLRGARGVDTLIPVLARAADAILTAGHALESIALDLTKIGTDTARAVSDTVEIKRHLKAITEREQVLRRELDAVKLQLAPRRRAGKGAAGKGATGKGAKRKNKRRRT